MTHVIATLADVSDPDVTSIGSYLAIAIAVAVLVAGLLIARRSRRAR